VDASLRRLQTDYIDLYQVHWPSAPPVATPIADTMSALIKLKDQGKIRAIGVSNVTMAELQEYLRCGPVVSDQFRYSMLCRDYEKDILPFCAQNHIATLTYMSLEQGLLTGKFGMDRVFKSTEFRSDTNWNMWFIPANRRKVLDLLSSWKGLVEKYQCTLSQLVLAWTTAQNGVTHVLAGGRNVSQVKDNAKAGSLLLDADDISRICRDVIALGEPVKE
jgi:methylglyoxal reductase